MEVLSYLELWQKDSEFIDKYNEFLERDSIDFYSQPFKPELIKELFEGWEIHFSDQFSLYDIYKCMEREYFIFLNKDFSGAGYKSNTSFGYCNTYYPRTLDDFINDCKRAGIELEWKNE